MAESIFTYKPISIECIIPEIFPTVALYVKNGSNYVLYKARENKFTDADYNRLKRTFTEFLYLRNDEAEIVNRFMEDNLTTLLSKDNIDPSEKEKLLCQIATNYVSDVFKSTETVTDFNRAKELLGVIIKHMTSKSDLMKVFAELAKDNFYIFTHCSQVTALTMYVHDKLYAIDPDELLDVGIGAMFHDIGLAFLLDDIATNPNALMELAPRRFAEHVEHGYDFLKGLGIFGELPLNTVLYHHEKYDGSGYPKGLTGDKIPRSAQVAAICDLYCTLTTDRPYRKASTSEEALQIMEDQIKIFNKDLFYRFKECVQQMGAVVEQ